MQQNYNYSNGEKKDIFFEFNNNEIEIISDNIKLNEYSKNKELKEKLPNNKIFRINSLIVNPEKRNREIYIKYNCIYKEKENSLYLIFNNNNSKFTKDLLINILQFSISLGIESLCLLIPKSNKKYFEIIQDMIIVGFKIDKIHPKITIDGNVYKLLKMPIKDIYQEIREISLI